MARGEAVTVLRRRAAGSDALGATVWEPDGEEAVSGVLVAPGDPQGLREDNRPGGTLARYTLYLPKSWRGDVPHGTPVVVRGEELRAVGEPQDWGPSGCPGAYDRVVVVEASHG